jgi:hypothetical protein
MDGGNYATNYHDNPYFDGVISAITTQGEVTVNCRQDRREVEQRRMNIQKSTINATSYPGGDSIGNMHVLPHELVFSWVRKQARYMIPGHPNQIGWTSLNGINYGQFNTDEEMEMAIRFVGLAKTPFEYDNPKQLQHGFTAISVGSGTTFNTGNQEFFPGDYIKWRVIPRPIVGGNFEGGEFGGRQGNPRVGTERGKWRMIIEPMKFNDLTPSINAAVSAMMRPKSAGGISDVSFEDLFSRGRQTNTTKLTPNQEHAAAILYGMTVAAVRAAKFFADEGLLGNAVTVDEITLVNQLGLFSSRPGERVRLNRLRDVLFLNTLANQSTSRVNLIALKNSVPGGFKGNRTTRNQTTASRYARVATQLLNYMETGYARAVYAETRKCIGVAQSFSKKGQATDILLGHYTLCM